jgi:hypothetical protein
MLDLASKAAINFLEWHVSIQASNLLWNTGLRRNEKAQYVGSGG